MPTLPMMFRLGDAMSVIGTGVIAGGLVKSATHSGDGDGLSASKAYSLSFIVAT